MASFLVVKIRVQILESQTCEQIVGTMLTHLILDLRRVTEYFD